MKPKLFVFALFFALVCACSKQAVQEAGPRLSGKKIFFDAIGGCSGCHNISDRNFVGPGLAGVSRRHTERWLKKWLKDPEKVWKENDEETRKMKKRLGRENKRNPTMKLLKPLPDEEIRVLVKYLKEL